MTTLKLRACKSALFIKNKQMFSIVKNRLYTCTMPEDEKSRTTFQQLINLGYLQIVTNPQEAEERGLPMPSEFLDMTGGMIKQ